MLKKIAIGIKDVKAGAFHFDPIFALNKGTAMRSLGDMVGNAELVFVKHPDDYHFFLLGEFDVLSGILAPTENGPEFLCSARDLLPNGGL